MGLTEAKVDQADFSEGLEVALGLWNTSFRGSFAAWVAVGDTTGLAEGEAEDAFYAALCWGPVDDADRAELVAGLERLLKEIPGAHATLEEGADGLVRLLDRLADQPRGHGRRLRARASRPTPALPRPAM